VITQIGFFHFGSNHAEPLGELESALRAAGQKQDIARSLLVLPEAFNIQKSYRNPGECATDPAIITGLRGLAGTYGVTLIAGLILIDEATGQPVSVAYRRSRIKPQGQNALLFLAQNSWNTFAAPSPVNACVNRRKF
jgi:hypothetical protein